MEYQLSFLPNEHFWGGPTCYGTQMPIHAQSDYSADFRRAAPNQMTTVFLSDHGRYVWSDKPFAVQVQNGCLCFEGEAFELYDGGHTLRDAYLAAMRAHFPFEDKPLPEAFFKTAQYNTWMELVYDPTQEGVLRYARAIVENGFEPGILMIDEGWHRRYGVWDFDFHKFPDPKAMIDELHALGFRVMLWVTPLVTADGPDYIKCFWKEFNPKWYNTQFLRKKDGEVALFTWWNGVSAMVDLRKECDRAFLGDQLDRLMQVYGVDGFKFDGGSYHMYHPDNIVNGPAADDHDACELNAVWNEFGRRYTFHEYKDTLNGGGKATIQRLCDRSHRWQNNGIDTLVPCALLQGLMGYPYICPDMIGGGSWICNYFPDFKVDEQLFVRMAQASALFPMMQFSWAPWRVLSDESYAVVKEAAQLHVRMAERLWALVNETRKTGEPIIRTLEYNDPHCGYAEITDQFMLGTGILVCPVITKDTFEKEIVFPHGRWRAPDGRIFNGGTRVILPTPLEKLLWFERV